MGIVVWHKAILADGPTHGETICVWMSIIEETLYLTSTLFVINTVRGCGKGDSLLYGEPMKSLSYRRGANIVCLVRN